MFTLRWRNDVLEALADLYVAATPAERVRMAAAVDALNARLRSDPLVEGESRAGGYRITFISLLVVGFYVDKANREVRVARVKRYGK